jgi:hypothetical protein
MVFLASLCSAMEKIQERALRFIYEDYDSSYEDLLQKSKLPSLKIRRIRTIAIETFKIIHRVSLPNLFIYLPILFKIFNCLEAFLHIFEI